MRMTIRTLIVLAIVTAPMFTTGCGSGAPMPGASSPSSEEADAAGGMNKTGGAAEAPATGDTAPAENAEKEGAKEGAKEEAKPTG